MSTCLAIIAIATLRDNPGTAALVFLALAAASLAILVWYLPLSLDASDVVAAAFVGTTVMVIGTVLFQSSLLRNVPEILVSQAVAALLALAAFRFRAHRRVLVFGLAVAACVVVGISAVSLAKTDPIPIDVYLLHQAAGDALQAGRNPYTEGNVRVVESHPFLDRELIEEYTYPPFTMIAYAGSAALLGDSRYIGAAAVIVALGLMFWQLQIRWSPGAEDGNVDAMVVALLCANPLTMLVVYPAWTEALALPFLVLAAAWWNRRWLAASIMLGLALSTKQYFVLALPILLATPSSYRFRRLATTLGVVVFTLLPFAVWDLRGLFDGVVAHHLTREFRPDSASLAGLGIHIPIWASVVAAGTLGVVYGLRSRSGGAILIALSTVVAVFTQLSIRGFRNSWWLVVAVAVCGLGLLGEDESDRSPDTRRITSLRMESVGPEPEVTT